MKNNVVMLNFWKYIVNYFCAQVVCQICIDKKKSYLQDDIQIYLGGPEEELEYHGNEPIVILID